MAKQLRVQYEDDITRFNITWLQECRHLRLFVTNQGYIGLAPPATKEGDLVCVLLSADVPFILRHSDVHCRYLLIGETYGTHVAGMIYARELIEGDNSIISRREKFRRVSHVWHCFLGFPSAH
jgi:hypothetical protein